MLTQPANTARSRRHVASLPANPSARFRLAPPRSVSDTRFLVCHFSDLTMFNDKKRVRCDELKGYQTSSSVSRNTFISAIHLHQKWEKLITSSSSLSAFEPHRQLILHSSSFIVKEIHLPVTPVTCFTSKMSVICFKFCAVCHLVDRQANYCGLFRKDFLLFSTCFL